MTDKDTPPEMLDFKLIFYEHLQEDRIYSFDAQLIEADEHKDITITDVKIRTLIDPEKIFDWKLGKIYMLPVNKHTKLEGVYMLLLKWKKLVHPYLKDEEANPMKLNLDKNENYKPFKTDLETAKIIEEKHTTDIIPSVSDDKPQPQSIRTKDVGSQSLTETTKPLDSFQQMDKRDEEQILAEIKGHMIEEYVYQFKVGGKMITGVSYAGIKAMVVRRGGYEIISDTIIKENDYFLAKAKIQDKQLDLQGLGLGECAIHEPFARQKAMGKALRNAYRSIMDEGQFIAFIKQWKKQKEIDK